MKIEDINNYNSEKFIDSFKNIYEESKFITEHADKKRPFKNKKEMILIFLELFDNLDEETKINIIKKAAKMISSASQPVIIAGGGIKNTNGHAEVLELANVITEIINLENFMSLKVESFNDYGTIESIKEGEKI